MNSNIPIVFIVDDDFRVREALSSLISSAGIRVAAFGSAAEFLESEKPDAPACLVLDLQLPDDQRPRTPAAIGSRQMRPPIIFISGTRRYPLFGARHEGRSD